MSDIKCYLQEDDPPADHDLQTFGAVCGRCYEAAVAVDRENVLILRETLRLARKAIENSGAEHKHLLDRIDATMLTTR